MLQVYRTIHSIVLAVNVNKSDIKCISIGISRGDAGLVHTSDLPTAKLARVTFQTYKHATITDILIFTDSTSHFLI